MKRDDDWLTECALICDGPARKVHLLRCLAARLTFLGDTLRNSRPVIRRVTVLDWDNVTTAAVRKAFHTLFNFAAAKSWELKSTDRMGDI